MTPPTFTADLVLDSQAVLGEGSLWHSEEKLLYWVDIEGKKLHIYDPSTGQDRMIETPKMIGTVVPGEKGEAIIALEDGVYRLDLATEQMTLIVNPLANTNDMRFNDGKCDPLGRFWVGSLSLKGGGPIAALYQVRQDGTYDQMLDSVSISNGIVWSLDSTKMYYIDTPTRKVVGFDYDVESGEIFNKHLAVDIPEGIGYPDGMTIDSEGMIWIGMWGGFGVTRWNPETGAYLGKVEVPVQNVTSCAFGGDNLETLFITTASTGTSPDTLAKYPHSGGLFAVKTGHKGVPAFAYRKANN